MDDKSSPKYPAEEWEDPYPKKKTTPWLAGTTLLVSIYVLSFGPATLLHSKGIISSGPFLTAYKPMYLLAQHFSPVEGALSWYAGLWRKIF